MQCRNNWQFSQIIGYASSTLDVVICSTLALFSGNIIIASFLHRICTYPWRKKLDKDCKHRHRQEQTNKQREYHINIDTMASHFLLFLLLHRHHHRHHHHRHHHHCCCCCCCCCRRRRLCETLLAHFFHTQAAPRRSVVMHSPDLPAVTS
jgi:ABC-type nickel/cobalt efflux system permease component RcnA